MAAGAMRDGRVTKPWRELAGVDASGQPLACFARSNRIASRGVQSCPEGSASDEARGARRSEADDEPAIRIAPPAGGASERQLHRLAVTICSDVVAVLVPHVTAVDARTCRRCRLALLGAQLAGDSCPCGRSRTVTPASTRSTGSPQDPSPSAAPSCPCSHVAPPNSSRTLLLKPRAIDRPTSSP